MSPRILLGVLVALVGMNLVVTSSAFAAQPQNAPYPGPAGGGQTTAPKPAAKKKSAGNGNCSAAALAVNAVNPFSHRNLGSQAANGLGQLPGDIAGLAGAAAKGLAGDIMDQVTSWMVQAAQTVDGDVMKAVTSTSTPELSAQWYQQEFGYLAFFGAGLAAIVALLGVFLGRDTGRPGTRWVMLPTGSRVRASSRRARQTPLPSPKDSLPRCRPPANAIGGVA